MKNSNVYCCVINKAVNILSPINNFAELEYNISLKIIQQML